MGSTISTWHAHADTAAPGLVSGGEFAVLLAPSANRVYTENAVEMLRGELSVFDQCLLAGTVSNIRVDAMAEAPCVRFAGEGLTARDVNCLMNLSSAYVLFSVHDGMLAPVTGRRLDRYDDDLLTILKYRGKTNEQFTKLLLNVTAAAMGSAESFLSRQLRVLDPLCGRGTTLNQAIMYGWDAYGIDIDKNDTETYAAFIRRWLKDKRLKHTVAESRLRREGKTLGRRFSVEFAETKEAYKAGRSQTVDVVTADTVRSDDVHAAGSFDVIVADAPYGVQHGGIHKGTAGSRARLSRDPTALLETAIPGWARLLREGGAIGVAWNTLHTSREDLVAIMTTCGLHVMGDDCYAGFRHRVDHAIDRDLIVARKLRPR
ncbi:TRM11 family SAM-dependent methyltransferase [Phytoactinopolyspora limicola]|uniref:TRM11 family SAM-dependent methyltransferase n=1 Tax=Phytoactinopolyspora limicola TaxID=2715536 RepID=UPI001A9C28D3|nr:hypothetical protein [Phytoactinopolyspora limicola]